MGLKQRDNYNEDTITNYQDFMNKAVIKYKKIVCISRQCQGSITTVQEDIIALLAQNHRQNKCNPIQNKNENANTKTIKREPTSFVTHYKKSQGIKYKLGNTLDSNVTTSYFCDCPLRRNKLKRHTHHPNKCYIHNCWLKEKGTHTPNPTDMDATANTSEENNAYDSNSQASENLSLSGTSTPIEDV